MPYRVIRLLAYAPLLSCLVSSGWLAQANDTAAQLSVGGLTFTRTDAISIEFEHLTISPAMVRVRYRFRNRTAKDILLTVAFPLPDRVLSEERDSDNAIPVPDSPNFVGFETRIEGIPASFTVDQRALFKGRDITNELQTLGLAVQPNSDFADQVRMLPALSRDQLTESGLIGDDGEPNWTVRTRFVRQQTFPARRIVNVEHQYHTSLGGSAYTGLLKEYRNRTLVHYRRQYCVDNTFLSSVDRAIARYGAKELHESFMTYVLSTGANWAGPIREFVLVVDKGSPAALVSFCGENVRKVSPTTFMMTKKNFTPTRNLNVLIIGREIDLSNDKP
jgi:hypothetical protein